MVLDDAGSPSRGEIHAVNTVIDERRRLCFMNFGEIVESRLGAIRFVRDSCMVPERCRIYDITVDKAELETPDCIDDR